jgi:broad specificity phosphatase PhoE
VHPVGALVPATRLWLVRHGQSTWNQVGRWQGQADPPLSDLGLRQAESTARRLAPFDPATLHTSDLERCRQTAEQIARALGIPAKARTDLREIDIGTWSGHTRAEIEVAFPDEWARWRAGQDVARGGGETYRELQVRVVAALEEIAEAGDGLDAVVVTHGGCIRAAVTAALGLPAALDLKLGGVGNGSVSTLRVLPTGFRVEAYNDLGHLDGLVCP